MGKRKSYKQDKRNSKRRVAEDDAASEDMDDEIDAFHRQRDVIPLDINGDAPESDEDAEQPVFNLEGIDDEDDDDEDDGEDIRDTGLAAKIARQQKFLREKFGGVEDEMHEDEDEDMEEQKTVWGGRKSKYYDADNRDFEIQSSDDESLAEEEEEVIRLQKEKAKTFSLEDFGLEDESDRELTLEEISAKGIDSKTSARNEASENMDATYQEIAKDVNALTREEQMDVLSSSAPELIGLLSELNEAVDQLESKVNPVLNKVRNGKIAVGGGLQYLELKQGLLLSYCQAIAFYLLLKSEGQAVRDHPVIARLVEIKNLLDKVKELDENLPYKLEDIINIYQREETDGKLNKENDPVSSEFFTKDQGSSHRSSDSQKVGLPNAKTGSENVDKLKEKGKKEGKHKQVGYQMSVQSMEMLKVRALLEEKLKQKDFTLIEPKQYGAKKHMQPINRKLEAYGDFNDDTDALATQWKGQDNSASAADLMRLVSAKLKPKVISGDDDLPTRDDIGERRRKYELQMLARAGVESKNGTSVPESNSDSDDGVLKGNGEVDSEDELYKQVKRQRAAELAAKAEIYSRTTATPSSPEIVNGKRKISYQMEKNRGLTRKRKKLTKNPRKKYKLKFQDAENRRKGQVREVKKPIHLYGGEATGINPGISRSIRFKS
ncbi:something about silencing protein 10 isoform X2 [Benincasa hispida]|uniref:something about silencing protein 10 isoform X2 n=1 Tax=Benincasa hispida TaxID=102211 RepID=UPI00190013EB|nr:something about silencing protein 10 isoform X2 [Benincasa hispida]